MRILLLTDLFPPFIGGLEQHVRNLGQGLVKRGHDVAVATMSHGNLPRYEVEQGVRIHRMQGTAQRAATVMNRIIARERPAIVHAHNWLLHSFLPLKAWSGARLVVTLHDYGVVCARRDLMYRASVCSGPGLSKCLRCAARTYGAAKGILVTVGNWATQRAQWSAVDMYLPVSHAVAAGNELAKHGLPFHVVPNFVPDGIASRAQPDDPSLTDLPKTPYLLFVGALSRHKGIDVLLQAYERLPNAPPLVLIGTKWPDTPSRFPPNTVVLQDVPHNAVMAAWRRSVIGIVPSVFPDPCPTVVMEAMASGVPVVASRIGGLPSLVIEGETGLLTAAGSVLELQDALARLLGDPAMVERMGRAAKREVRSFTATAVVKRLERIYSDLLATTEKRPSAVTVGDR
jgi:glycosyltransferase involved in cell wall biosynthesis